MYTRPTEPHDRVDQDSASRTSPRCCEANVAAFQAGYNFGETAELFDHPYEVKPAHAARRASTRNITGNIALSYGLVAAGAAGQAAALLRVVPDHAGVRHPPRAVEAQELRRAHAAGRGRDRRPSASRSAPRSPGSLGDHHHERPGRRPEVARRIGLAVSLELPLIIVDMQRGGPSTGLPTKTEQADLLLAMYGRHGEAPLPIVAAQSPTRLLRRRDRGGRASRSSTARR